MPYAEQRLCGGVRSYLVPVQLSYPLVESTNDCTISLSINFYRHVNCTFPPSKASPLIRKKFPKGPALAITAIRFLQSAYLQRGRRPAGPDRSFIAKPFGHPSTEPMTAMAVARAKVNRMKFNVCPSHFVGAADLWRHMSQNSTFENL